MSSIYGIFTGSHSPNCALVKDGEIVCVIEEERISRIKAGDVYDINCEQSYRRIEEYTGLKIKDADYKMFALPVPNSFASKISGGEYEVCAHHDAHTYAAYYTSGMEGKVMTISYDGGGENTVMKIYLCEDGKMTLLKSLPIATFGSLSHLWGFSTSAIMGYDKYRVGKWKMCKDEGKLMGMAPDGLYDEKIYKILNSIIDYKDFRFFPSSTAWKTMFVVDNLFDRGYLDTQEKREIFSYNLQKLTNDLMLKFFQDIHKTYPDYKKFCFAGGLFANVKLNQQINELDWVEEIYVLPPMGDEGLGLGACIKKAVEIGEWTKPKKLKNVFFGPRYSNDEVYKFSETFNFNRKKYDVKEIAQDIHDGKVVGWFKGGSEHGPRALGARSILVRPTDYQAHSLLNRRLNRHDTMPFAPIVMDEHFDDIFTCTKSKYTAEFMTLCYSTKEEWIEKIPAVIQKSDKTARPQLVKKENLPEFWEILNEYHQISSIPVLLNTSFNSHNEPIVENPTQAFNMLNKKIIDKLVIEDYVYFIE